MTSAEIAKLPTPKCWARQEEQQAGSDGWIFARTLEQQLAAATTALEALSTIALVTNSNYAQAQANNALGTLASIKEMD